jgi:hypothetical protein
LLPKYGHDTGTRPDDHRFADFETLPAQKSGFYVIVRTRDKADDAPSRSDGFGAAIAIIAVRLKGLLRICKKRVVVLAQKTRAK